MSAETWTYTLDNPDNPNKGEVRSSNGELICVRAVMNPDDERIMRRIAAAPELLAALDALLEAMEPPRSQKATKAWTAAYAAVAKAQDQKP